MIELFLELLHKSVKGLKQCCNCNVCILVVHFVKGS